MTKVYKATLMIVDDDNIGPEAIKEEIEETLDAMTCIAPEVMEIIGVEAGEEIKDENHPLNHINTMKDEFEKLFAGVQK